MILFQGQLVSAFMAKRKRRLFQGQKEGISANGEGGVLAGNGGESLGAGFRQAPMLPKQSTPKTEQSLVNVHEERVRVKPNSRLGGELSDQRSWGSESLATKDKCEDGRLIGPNSSSPCYNRLLPKMPLRDALPLLLGCSSSFPLTTGCRVSILFATHKGCRTLRI